MALNLSVVRSLKEQIMDATEQAANDLILTKAKEYIPKDTDTADKSGRVVRDGNRVVVTFGLDTDSNPKTGQSSNTYIETLEEDMEMRHAPGMGAKFLTRAADEAAGGFAAAVAQRIKR